MPRKPILAAASIVIASTGAASGAVPEDEIVTVAPDEDAFIQLGGDLPGTEIGLPFHLDPDDQIGIDYAQTYWGGGGGGGDGVIQGPVKTPKLQDRVQTRQPNLQQPKLQTQPSVQAGDQKPGKRRIRKKRIRK